MSVATLNLYYTRWCVHSKKVIPHWLKYEWASKNGIYKLPNNCALEFVIYDLTDSRYNLYMTPNISKVCEIASLTTNSQETNYLMKFYNVQAFPTIRLSYKGKTTEYHHLDKVITTDSLNEFVKKEMEHY